MRRCKFFFWHLWLVCEFFIYSYCIKLLTRDEIVLRHKLVKNTTRIAKRFLSAFQVKLIVNNSERLAQMHDTNYLAIANHVSYTDIILLSSIENFVFITSVEMSQNVFLGSITRYGGCLFTDRKKFVSLPKEIDKFADTIRQGFKVMLFPEGTSTNGETVKDFRKSLFQVAVSAKCPILPICVHYKKIDGKPIDSSTRDLICWYGDMDFAPHFMKIIGHTIEAEIHILDPIYDVSMKTRQTLSDEAFTQIHDCYHKDDPSSFCLTD